MPRLKANTNVRPINISPDVGIESTSPGSEIWTNGAI